MPATVTHAYFAKDVYDILPDTIKDKIDINRLKMFAQGFDPIKFYNLFSILPGKKIREKDFYFHTHDTRAFFTTILKTMKDKKLMNDTECLSFLFGFICHYVSDSNIHPYVIYKSGEFDKKKKETYKYNNIHMFMETFIDNDMIKRRENINPYKFRLDKYCFDTREFSINLDYVIDDVFSKIFYVKDMSYIYYKSCKQMKRDLYLFRRDRFGIKKNIYKLVDTFTPKNFFRFESVSYHYTLEDKHNFLNSNNKLWRNPTTYDMTSTESFFELYMRSIREARTIICASYDYLNGKHIDLNKIFTNKNYVTGIDCELQKELKYFEY